MGYGWDDGFDEGLLSLACDDQRSGHVCDDFFGCQEFLARGWVMVFFFCFSQLFS
jgi:hypothetical protein